MLPRENNATVEGNKQAIEMDKDWLAGMFDGDGNVTLRVYKRKNNLDSVVKRLRIGTISTSGLAKLISCFNLYGLNPYIFTRAGEVPFFEVNVHKAAHLNKCVFDMASRSIAKRDQLLELFKFLSNRDLLYSASKRISDLNITGIERGRNIEILSAPSAAWVAGIIDSDGYLSKSVSGVVNTDWRIINASKLFADNLGINCYIKERITRPGWATRKDLLFTKKRDIDLLYDSIRDHLAIKSIEKSSETNEHNTPRG